VNALVNTIVSISGIYKSNNDDLIRLKDSIKKRFNDVINDSSTQVDGVANTLNDSIHKYSKNIKKHASHYGRYADNISKDLTNRLAVVGSSFFGPLGLLTSSLTGYFSRYYGTGNIIHDTITVITKSIPNLFKGIKKIGSY